MFIFLGRENKWGEDRERETSDDDTEWNKDIEMIETWYEHFGTDECEDCRETVFQVHEVAHHARECEVERSKTEDCEDITCIHDEHIVWDSEDCWNRIDREDKVCKLDHEERYEHRCRSAFCDAQPPFTNSIFRPPCQGDVCYEFSAVHLFADRHDFFEEPDDEFSFEFDLFFALEEHLDRCDDEESSEDVDDEIEWFDDLYAQGDKDGTHGARSYDTPEEDFMLIGIPDFEIRENKE